PAPQAISETNTVAIASFLSFVAITLVITWWAARRTTSSAEFFAAGGRISAGQNGFALAGDYMSAASFLGIAGLVATSGFDGLIYSVGFLVGWPVMMFLVAEPLRNLGKYTFADVVAYRLRGRPVRIAAAISTLTVVSFYLVGQMVGAGELVHLLFGLPYRAAVVIVGGVMLVYVLFGGMIATTWVQIIKAALLLTGATVLAILVLSKYGFDPLALFDDANRTHPTKHVLAPGKLVADPIDTVSLGIALMFGTAGLPHILMRFYTVPDARTARRSVAYATLLIGFFYLVTFVLGFGASALVDLTGQGSNMAAPLLARELGGTALLGFIAAVAFATILAVVAGLTLSGSAALAHDLWGHVVRRGKASEAEQLRVARYATIGLAVVAIALGILAEGQNVAFIVGLTFALAASANFPALLLSISWRRLTTRGAVASMVVGTITTLTMIALSPTLMGKDAIVPLKNPGIITVPLSFLVAIVVSLMSREPEAEQGFDDAHERIHLGADPGS
ncbi:MAG: sodium/solute symporter, partial [Kofleriaceae bacterium]